MRRVLSLAFVAALSLTASCYLKVEPGDVNYWACDDTYPLGQGRTARLCYRTWIPVQ
jgi:hypothetical protein